MTDELGRRVEAAAQRSPEGSPDLESVLKGGRRARRRRVLLNSAEALGFMSLVTFAALNLGPITPAPRPELPATHGDGVFVPAEDGDVTYVLGNFRIEYPWARVDGMPGMKSGSDRRRQYCSARPDYCRSDGQAGFFYEYEWSSDRHPGTVDCRVMLYSKNGDLVGQELWGLSGLEHRSREPHVLPVPVTGEPDVAEASCEAATLKAGHGYRFIYQGSEPYEPGYGLPERLRLIFDVEQLKDHPGGESCTIQITFQDGETTTGSFTMSGTAEDPLEFETGHVSSRPIADATLTCNPF